MNMQTESKGFPKFENLEALIKDRAILKQVVNTAQKRILEIEKTLEESIQALQYTLSENFSPPPSGDGDIQLVITKLSNLMKAATPLPGSQIKTPDTSPGNQGSAAGAPNIQIKAVDVIPNGK